MSIKKNLTSFLIKLILGVLLLWLCGGMGVVLGKAYTRLPWSDRTTWVFFIGFGSYLILHFVLYKPILSHVMAHELTHALAAVLMGGKVTAIHATTSGGSTTVNKSNILISLAPYIFPLYTVVTVGLYLLAAQPFKIYLMGLIGFTYAFHLALTAYSLTHPQTDLKEGGMAFSLIFILAGNMIGAMLLTSLVWPQVLPLSSAFPETFRWSWRLALGTYHWFKPHPIPPEAHVP